MTVLASKGYMIMEIIHAIDIKSYFDILGGGG